MKRYQMMVPDTRPDISNKTSLEVVSEFVKEHGLADDCIHEVWGSRVMDTSKLCYVVCYLNLTTTEATFLKLKFNDQIHEQREY